MLTQERKDILKSIVDDNKQLGSLNADEALEEINKLGYNFTLDEIKAFGETMRSSGELDFDMLDNVAGGFGDDYAEEDTIKWLGSFERW